MSWGPRESPRAGLGQPRATAEWVRLSLLPFQALLKTGEHSWSLAELIQALVLLTHCHSLASFVFGCGILPEGDAEGSPASQAPSPPSEQGTPPSGDPLNNSGVSRWSRVLMWAKTSVASAVGIETIACFPVSP
jgi:hypothetical protein